MILAKLTPIIKVLVRDGLYNKQNKNEFRNNAKYLVYYILS